MVHSDAFEFIELKQIIAFSNQKFYYILKKCSKSHLRGYAEVNKDFLMFLCWLFSSR